ncbi:uncharacterized protein KY384_000719 [Bacidia gigantensis]|uniref:uncharacterized protein n=1 Tax=Bacidia gigantensis TaxID=2732470 RepID=UPI001D04D06C|nr:uncharacterized protein KY384_000719 [Bacidia gigantensis]KAG8525957.1 hypothetical protein KY384_000719 [Bacidia gigantensis]
MLWVFFWRVLLGIGIGGDYPISASIVAERSHLKSRGQMLGWIFSNQGWGNLVGCVVSLVVLACFSGAIGERGEYGQLDAVWRLQIGVALIPALATLWPRLTMPEGKKFLESRELRSPRPNSVGSVFSMSSRSEQQQRKKARTGSKEVIVSEGRELQAEIDAARAEIERQGERARFDVFVQYMKDWRHLKTLLGTMGCWFLLDVAFYGVNLNQSIILREIGFTKGESEYERLRRNVIGNLIIAIAGYVPGYFVTIALVEKLGRRWIQLQGFLICALMFAVIAGGYNVIGTAGKFVCLGILQVCHHMLRTHSNAENGD